MALFPDIWLCGVPDRRDSILCAKSGREAMAARAALPPWWCVPNARPVPGLVAGGRPGETVDDEGLGAVFDIDDTRPLVGVLFLSDKFVVDPVAPAASALLGLPLVPLGKDEAFEIECD